MNCVIFQPQSTNTPSTNQHYSKDTFCKALQSVFLVFCTFSNFRWATSKSYKKAYATSKRVKCPEDCYTPRVVWPLFRQEVALVALQLYPSVDQLTEWPLRPPLNLPFLMTTTLLPSNLGLQGKTVTSAKGLLCNNLCKKNYKIRLPIQKMISYTTYYTILYTFVELILKYILCMICVTILV